MAINIAAMQRSPDILGNFQRGLQFGQQQRAIQEQRADEQKLRELAPGVISGDPDAYSQAAAINPKAASEYEQAGNSQAQKFRNWFNYTDQALKTARETKNMAPVNAALREGAPYVSKIIGKPIPSEWTPDMDAGWEQLRAKVAMIGQPGAGQKMFAQKVGDDGYIYNSMADGTMVNTGIKADRQMWLRDFPGAAPELIDKGGQVRPIAGAEARPAEAQTAYEKEAAQLAAQLQYLPSQERIKLLAAIERAGAEADIKAGADQASTQRSNDAALRVYQEAVEGLSSGLEGATTGPLVGRIPALTANQQIAEGGVAAMAPVLKQLFRTAGEGTFTDKDQELLLRMVPTRTDLPEARDAKLQNIDRIVRAKLNAAPQQPSGTGAPRRLKFNPATGRIE